MTDERGLRPDPQMEGRVGSWLTETDLTSAEADQGFDRLMHDFPVTPQARRRFLGRWFERDAGTRRRADDHDHPPDSRRTRLMFSATGLVAAFAVLALAVNVVPTDTNPPSAGTGSTLSVAADGSGDYSSIAKAVAAAADGDTVMVGPGTYTEAIVIDKDITLMGDGPREEVVIVAPEGGPNVPLLASSEQDPYALHISDGEATVADMTFRGQPSEVIISGGSPTLTGLVLEDVGVPYGGGSLFGGSSIVVQGPETSATILDNELLRGGPIALFGDAVATVKDNVLSDGPHLFIHGHGAGTEIVGNTVNGTLRFGLNVHLREPLIIAGNSFSPGGSSSVGIRIKSSQEIPAEGTFVVEDNIVDGGSGNGTGINVESGDGVEVRDNVVTNSRSGVIWGRGDGTLEGNTTTGSAAGLTILGGSPVLTSNTSCDNTGSNLFVAGSATPEIGENDFCPEPVAD